MSHFLQFALRTSGTYCKGQNVGKFGLLNCPLTGQRLPERFIPLHIPVRLAETWLDSLNYVWEHRNHQAQIEAIVVPSDIDCELKANALAGIFCEVLFIVWSVRILIASAAQKSLFTMLWDHLVIIPRPDDWILSARCDNVALGDAWEKIWFSSISLASHRFRTKKTYEGPALDAKQAIIETERPLIALVAFNWEKENNWKYK
jgi:hypothetical protein